MHLDLFDTFAGMKTLLLSILLGLAGCGGGSGQANADYKPTATDSATNGLYKPQPSPAGSPRR